jgi:hypothetical protein
VVRSMIPESDGEGRDRREGGEHTPPGSGRKVQVLLAETVEWQSHSRSWTSPRLISNPHPGHWLARGKLVGGERVVV